MMATTEEQAALKDVMQMLEKNPDSPAPSVVPTLLNPSSNDIPNQRERLAVLITTGKSKEAIGVQLLKKYTTPLKITVFRTLRMAAEFY